MRTSDDTSGLIGDLIRFGTIETADLDAREYTVRCGDVISPPIRRLAFAGQFSTWCPLTVGEQVVLLCAEGDIAHAVIVGSLETETFPGPATGNRLRLKMPDDSLIDYDVEASVLTLELAGQAVIKAPAGMTIEANVDITGNVKVTGAINATGEVKSDQDVKAAAISLKTHKHGGVSAGAAKTAVPE